MPPRIALIASAALAALQACADPIVPAERPPSAVPPPVTAAPAVSSFELVGGYRLEVAYASEGLALVTDTAGFVIEAIAGAHAHTSSVNLYDLSRSPGTGADAEQYPLLAPFKTWKVTELFPRWIEGQSLRDVTAVRTGSGYELAGIGRVFYNTSPRASTQINVRAVSGRGSAAALGAARQIPVDLPEQEFSGFIKHADPARDLGAIGAGAYDSGQGSVGGLSYAIREANGSWTRLLRPPGFGDLTSPRLPRDDRYSCPDGMSWVCLPPVAGRGVWSTERIGGGGVRFGDHVLFIATLGYGPRTYSRQSYTFGDPAQDRAVAYFFSHDATGAVSFRSFEPWPHAAPGENVIGTAIGRLRGSTALHLLVVKTMAWGSGRDRTGSVLQVFRIRITG